jgi:hypothetical protein
MKLLCSVSNLGYLVSLKVAVDAEGIETHLSDADRAMGGIAGPMGSVGRLYLIDEDDLEAAHAVMESLETRDAVACKTTTTAIDRRPVPSWVIVAGAALGAAMSGLILAYSV